MMRKEGKVGVYNIEMSKAQLGSCFNGSWKKCKKVAFSYHEVCPNGDSYALWDPSIHPSFSLYYYSA